MTERRHSDRRMAIDDAATGREGHALTVSIELMSKNLNLVDHFLMTRFQCRDEVNRCGQSTVRSSSEHVF